MQKNALVRPFLKWAGGKRQLLPVLSRFAPAQYQTYFEPFLGGGAVLLAMQPERAIVNDANPELINSYQVVRDQTEDLIAWLTEHAARNNADYYDAVRNWDRAEDYALRDPVERAARIIYLNKTCYNGLFRVNARGHFNVPYGKYARPAIADAEVLRAVGAYLRRAAITFRCGDFAAATDDARAGDFVYCDPPYDPVSATASFTSYAANRFDRAAQERLKLLFDALTARGCAVLLSNAYTPYIAALYQGYHCERVAATRAINSVAARRGKVDEILVINDCAPIPAHPASPPPMSEETPMATPVTPFQSTSTITCPHCRTLTTDTMPTDACVIRWTCPQCQAVLLPDVGDCCVFCSYGSVPCPPIQAEQEERR